MPHHRSIPSDQMPPPPGNFTVASIMYRSIPKPPISPPPPPRANPGVFDCFEKFWSNSLDGRMPHPLELQRESNPPPSRENRSLTFGNKQNRLPLETNSEKFSATTSFLFSLSSLHALNKGIFHDITVKNDNNRKTHVESTIAMTRFDRKVKCPTGRASFGSNSLLYGAFKKRVKCPGIARGGMGGFGIDWYIVLQKLCM